jgi:hypothetical protein
MSKYEPLQRFLLGRLEGEVPMSFESIEGILGFDLPPSARKYAPWWSNEGGTHAQARAWLDAGWRTSKVDVPSGRVVFVQDPDAGVSTPTPSTPTFPKGGAVAVELRDLSAAARRLLADYTAEADGDVGLAVERALNEAALARRGRLIDRIRANAPRVPDDSVDLIREDRDAR